jgi:hypothetical protein
VISNIADELDEYTKSLGKAKKTDPVSCGGILCSVLLKSNGLQNDVYCRGSVDAYYEINRSMRRGTE